MTLFIANGKTAIEAASGAPTPSPEFGQGDLGDVTITSLVEASGELHYNSLIIGSGGDLVAESHKKLIVRSVGDITVDPGRAIHADGRGFAGGTGGNGSHPSVPVNAAPGGSGECLHEGIAGGGGSGGSGGSDGSFVDDPSNAGPGGNSWKDDFDRPRFGAQELVTSSFLAGGALLYERSFRVPGGLLRSPGDYLEIDWVGTCDTGVTSVTFSAALEVTGTAPVPSSLTIAPDGAREVSGSMRFFARLYYVSNTELRVVVEGVAQANSDEPVKGVYSAVVVPGGTLASERFLVISVVGSSAVGISVKTINVRFNPSGAELVRGGNALGGTAEAGVTPTALSAASVARLSADYAAVARGICLMGVGGGGGGGSRSVAGGAGGTEGVGGSPSAQTGSSVGDGGAGTEPTHSFSGGAGGAGGAGGGHLAVWCGGDLTIGAGARISARGGAGGNGSGTGGNRFGGGGGGGGGGGFVGVFYAGSLSNSGSVAATGGAGGAGAVGSEITGANGAAGANGLAVLQKVA